MQFRHWPPIAISLLLSACAYRPNDVADPREISLRTAVFDVATTLADLQQVRRGQPKVGMIADEATVTFNVSAKSNETGDLKVDAEPAPIVGFPITLGTQYTLANESNRGNQITITFKNIATAKISPGDRALLERCARGGDCDSAIFSTPKPKAQKK